MHPAAEEVLSHSRISAFKNCPLAFRYRYIDHLPERPSPILFTGNVVHAALEALYKLPPVERTPQAAVSAVDPVIDDYLSADPEMAVAIDPKLPWPTNGATASPTAFAAFRNRVTMLIDRYFELEDPATVEVVGIERYVIGEVAEGVKVQGYIDRLDRQSDGSVVVSDYKTGKAPNPRFAADRWQQLQLYALLLQAEGERVSELRLHFLGGDAPQTMSSGVRSNDLASVGHEISYYAKLMRRAIEERNFPAKRQRLCDWCSFQAQCPAFGAPEIPLPY